MTVRAGIFVVVLLALANRCAAGPSESPLAASQSPPMGSYAIVAEVRHLPPVTEDGPARATETLQQASAVALNVDQRLAAKRWDLSSQEESLRLAQAQRWPIVAAEGSYMVRDNDRAFRFFAPGLPIRAVPFAQDEGFVFRTGVNVPLYTSGYVRHGIVAAEAGLSAAKLQVDGARNDLKLSVAKEYIAVLRAQRGVEVARSNVKSLAAHARDVEMLFAHQQVPRNDLLAAQVALSAARQRTIQADNLLDACRAAYNRRLGRPLLSEVRIAELPVESTSEEIESLTAGALRTRPEMARLSAEVHQLQHQASRRRAKNGPQVELLGEYAFEENRFQTPEGITSAGIAAHWNLFDAGRTRHEAAALSHRAAGVARLKADLESMISLEVRRAWLDVKETQRRIEVTREALQQADENLRVASKRYTSGTGTNTEVLDAETLRRQTYQSHDHATYDAVLAMIRLRHATGRLQ